MFLILLIFFQFQRLLFVFHFASHFEGNFGEVLLTPFMGIRLDLSAAAYFSILPFLLSFIAFFFPHGKGLERMDTLVRRTFWLMLLMSAMIMAGEIVTYTEWRTKLSTKIFLHFTTPSEVFRTASWANTIWFLTYVALQLLVAWLIYYKLFKRNHVARGEEVFEEDGKWRRILLAPVYGGLFAVVYGMAIRGGFQEIPVSGTNSYFSKKQIVNDLSVNSEWNFLNSFATWYNSDFDQFFQNLDPAEAERIMKEMYAVSGGEQLSVLTTDRPNIILVTLEGWSTQMIEPLGGEEGITPHFNRLCQDGLLFTNIYGTGTTSETGHSSLISGYLAIPGMSISIESAKCRKLPALSKSLKGEGYNSFYTFGGALSYGNIGGYLTDVGFDQLTDENDLDLEPRGKLGIHDEAMFPYFLSEIQKAKRPYFYGMFSQSTHPPYDIPEQEYSGYDGDPFVSSMHYADKHLNRFLNGVKNLPDYDNTLVVLIADHSRANIFNDNVVNEGFYHVPMLLWGGALKKEYHGEQISTIGSQADLPKTLLNQMGLNSTGYHWSKDLLHTGSPQWAINTSNISYALIDTSGMTHYLMFDDRMVYATNPSEQSQKEALKRCRAILECLYREYKEL